MEKTRLAIVIDEALRAVAIWLLSAVCLRYFIKEIMVIVILSTVITALFTFIIRRYYAKKNLSAEKIKRIEDAMRELTVCDRDTLLKRLSEALDAKVEDGAVISSSTMIYPYFYGKLPLETLNIEYNIAKRLGKKLLILCYDVSQDVEKSVDLFCDIPVGILRKKQSYEFLDKYQALPDAVKRPKKKIRLFKNALKKSKIKGYLACAVLLLLTAAFSPYAILCIIAASANIAMSILCAIRGN